MRRRERTTAREFSPEARLLGEQILVFSNSMCSRARAYFLNSRLMSLAKRAGSSVCNLELAGA